VSEWIWVKNEAVNDIPGRIPAGVLPAFEARGWVECDEPTDDVEVDAPRVHAGSPPRGARRPEGQAVAERPE